ncbi:inter-alpha-trypsin inhibitor heavy chain H3-like [Petromyzon marinus]|uniref:inter-alpha-trypsin inhibitor heavy chain H3-like n=1 Tax=Petromyzon marinus TaxID=7757 RepID=UPI003F6E7DF2
MKSSLLATVAAAVAVAAPLLLLLAVGVVTPAAVVARTESRGEEGEVQGLRPGRERREDEPELEDISVDGIELHSLHVESRVTSRFVDTVTTARLKNRGGHSRETTFLVQLPEHAFISNFTMVIDQELYVGVVKEKVVAKVQYEKAKSQGQSAGLVWQLGDTTDRFMVSVNVAPQSKVTLQLGYQELLRRRLGRYELKLSLRPRQLAHSYKVDVHIYEPQGLRFVDVAPFQSSQAVNITKGEHKAHVSFHPALSEQRRCPSCLQTRFDGDLVVLYDVHHDASTLQIVNGYFVHYFAPANLSPLAKNIVFIIDVSSSMWGTKLKQTKEALHEILAQLRPDDHFGLIEFSSTSQAWRESMLPASPANVRLAQEFAATLRAQGATNINDAVLAGSAMLRRAHRDETLPRNSASLIVLLTDGDPTVGVRDLGQIRDNVRMALAGEASLFCLGFGQYLDYNFLERMALENGGLARRIYENADAPLQLQGFYQEVATPLLARLHVSYPPGAVSDVTRTDFDNFFDGTEIVVAGRLADNSLQALGATVEARAEAGDLTLTKETPTQRQTSPDDRTKFIFGEFTERLWAYLTIKHLLERRSITQDEEEKGNATARALELSLKYGFVTPLTSMVITKPPRPRKQAPTAKKLEKNSAKRPSTFVDNDPHVVVELPGQQQKICFNIDEEPGTIVNLIDDPTNGLAVDAELVAAKRADERTHKMATYFGRVGVRVGVAGVRLEATTEGVRLTDAHGSTSLPWGGNITLERVGLTLKMAPRGRYLEVLELRLPTGTLLSVRLHRVWPGHPEHRDYLGVYVADPGRLSPSTHGLLGQFLVEEPELKVWGEHPGLDPNTVDAYMQVKGHTLTVTRGEREDPTGARNVSCWFVHHHGAGFIDGRHADYVVPDIFSFLGRALLGA